ncbi:MAG TPA: PASTA domain-containing protein [Actinomycetota bacterium]|nr:PASTA domain-containing protein [Actinomycetota bacterium]
MAERFSRFPGGIEPVSEGPGRIPTAGGFQPIAARVPREDAVFVDVGSRKIDANVSRDGVPIGALPIDRDRFQDFFGGKPAVTHKVVSQSVAPGTPIPVGSKVDLVLAEPRQIPIGVVAGVHLELQDLTIGEVFEDFVADNVDVRRVLARVEDPDHLTPQDENIIKAAFAQQDVDVGDEAGRDAAAAFQTLKAAFVFGQ